MQFVWMIVFGVLGVLARYLTGQAVTRIYGDAFPWGTFAVNVAGAFLVGVAHVAGIERQLIPQDLRLGLTVGFLGGFTTFSAYCLESGRLIETADWTRGLLYLGLSPALGLAAMFAGLYATRTLLGTG